MHYCANFLSTCLSLSHTQYCTCTIVQVFFHLVSVYLIHRIHALLCEFSFNLSEFISCTVLYMLSCANFLSTCLSLSHTQYYTCTLVRIFLLTCLFLSYTVLYTHSWVNFSLILSQFLSNTVPNTHSCAKFFFQLVSVTLIHSTKLALLCDISFNLSKFSLIYEFYTRTHVCIFLLTCPSFSHTLHFTRILVQIFFQLV
jgi:hypothetical protein